MMQLHSGAHYDWLLSMGALYVYSCAIRSLPDPKPEERWYGFLFKFLNLLGANLDKFKNGSTVPVPREVYMEMLQQKVNAGEIQTPAFIPPKAG